MVINPTYLAQRTRTSISWIDAKRRVLMSYRDWLRAAPEIQSMYGINYPVSAIRTKLRQEFERNRYVNDMAVVDVLISQSHQEYQTGVPSGWRGSQWRYQRPSRVSYSDERDASHPIFSTYTGNHELLETTIARPKILPSRRGSTSAVAQGFYQRLLGGTELNNLCVVELITYLDGVGELFGSNATSFHPPGFFFSCTTVCRHSPTSVNPDVGS